MLYDALSFGWRWLIATLRVGVISVLSLVCVVVWGLILVVGAVVIISGLVVSYPLVVILNWLTGSAYDLSVRGWKKTFDDISSGVDPTYD